MKIFIIKLIAVAMLPLVSNAYLVQDYKFIQKSTNAGCFDPDISTQGSIVNYIPTESLNIISGQNTITLNFNAITRVCHFEQINGQRKYAYTTVNPFSGFEVPYFSEQANDIRYRHEIINKLVPANRWEILILNEKSGKTLKHIINPQSELSAQVSMSLKLRDLLSGEELNKLNNGDVVTVNLILFQVLNLTTTLEQACYQFGNRQVANSYLNLKLTR